MRITYALDSPYAICLHRPGREPEEIDRGLNAAMAKHKAERRAKERGLSCGPATGPAKAGTEPAKEPEDMALLDVLDQSIPKLTAALEAGHYDEHLAILRRAEKAGENRKGALREIDKRR